MAPVNKSDKGNAIFLKDEGVFMPLDAENAADVAEAQEQAITYNRMSPEERTALHGLLNKTPDWAKITPEQVAESAQPEPPVCAGPFVDARDCPVHDPRLPTQPTPFPRIIAAHAQEVAKLIAADKEEYQLREAIKQRDEWMAKRASAWQSTKAEREAYLDKLIDKVTGREDAEPKPTVTPSDNGTATLAAVCMENGFTMPKEADPYRNSVLYADTSQIPMPRPEVVHSIPGGITPLLVERGQSIAATLENVYSIKENAGYYDELAKQNERRGILIRRLSFLLFVASAIDVTLSALLFFQGR